MNIRLKISAQLLYMGDVDGLELNVAKLIVLMLLLKKIVIILLVVYGLLKKLEKGVAQGFVAI